ncbi:MAG: hypothetical protein B7Z40_00255 [Bosea sp. 12-68-7]|nr:MAG: hypothetical protein B7Z40_00255 [Bosea sp. 12-68-7]
MPAVPSVGGRSPTPVAACTGSAETGALASGSAGWVVDPVTSAAGGVAAASAAGCAAVDAGGRAEDWSLAGGVASSRGVIGVWTASPVAAVRGPFRALVTRWAVPRARTSAARPSRSGRLRFSMISLSRPPPLAVSGAVAGADAAASVAALAERRAAAIRFCRIDCVS